MTREPPGIYDGCKIETVLSKRVLVLVIICQHYSRSFQHGTASEHISILAQTCQIKLINASQSCCYDADSIGDDGPRNKRYIWCARKLLLTVRNHLNLA